MGTKRTSSILKSVFHYKVHYFGLEICFHPFLFPNKKAETHRRVKLFIELGLALVRKDLMFYFYGMDGPIIDLVLRPILTVATVWNTGEIGDIYYIVLYKQFLAFLVQQKYQINLNPGMHRNLTVSVEYFIWNKENRFLSNFLAWQSWWKVHTINIGYRFYISTQLHFSIKFCRF